MSNVLASHLSSLSGHFNDFNLSIRSLSREQCHSHVHRSLTISCMTAAALPNSKLQVILGLMVLACVLTHGTLKINTRPHTSTASSTVTQRIILNFLLMSWSGGSIPPLLSRLMCGLVGIIPYAGRCCQSSKTFFGWDDSAVECRDSQTAQKIRSPPKNHAPFWYYFCGVIVQLHPLLVVIKLLMSWLGNCTTITNDLAFLHYWNAGYVIWFDGNMSAGEIRVNRAKFWLWFDGNMSVGRIRVNKSDQNLTFILKYRPSSGCDMW